jgi:predicted AAA+ superfamily ATPase
MHYYKIAKILGLHYHFYAGIMVVHYHTGLRRAGKMSMTEEKFSEICALSRQYLTTQNQPYQRVQRLLFEHRLAILLGPRGVGKTTLIIQYLLDYAKQDINSPKILYVPADHFILGATSLYEIAEYFQLLGGELIALDEIHKYPSWSQELKSIYDTFPKLHVIASGSSALAIYQGSHDLTRRAIVSELVGFSLREYLELEHGISLKSYSLVDILEQHELVATEIIKIVAEKNIKILAEFKRYLQSGYYPYAREMKTQNLYWITLEQNLHTTIESDLAAIFPKLTGNSIRKLKQLLAFIAVNVPFVPNLQKLKEVLQIADARTLKTYLKYLEDAKLIRQLRSASSKFSQLEIPEKIYLDNTNQLYAISKSAQNMGTVRELFFLSMLSYQHKVTAPKQGDFLVDESLLFEVGGRKKQGLILSDKQKLYLACDEIENGIKLKIPLWLFGFLY